MIRKVYTIDMSLFETKFTKRNQAQTLAFRKTRALSDVVRTTQRTIESMGGILTTARLLYNQNSVLLGYMLGAHVVVRLLNKLLNRLSRLAAKAAETEEDTAQLDFQAVFSAIESRSFFAMARFFGREETNANELDVLFSTWSKRQASIGGLQALFRNFTKIVRDSGQYLAYWRGGTEVIAGRLKATELANFVMQSQRWINDLEGLHRNYDDMQYNMTNVREVSRFFDQKPEIGLTGPQYTIPAPGSGFDWSIEFKDAEFAYPSDAKLILNGLNLKIAPGQIVGICGKTHCGKSTVLRLVERLYDVTKGEVLIGGQPIKSLEPSWLRKHMGFVTSVKDTCVVGGESILRNIELGALIDDPKELEARAKEAAKLADLDGDVREFSKTWHTTIGDRGDVNLSDGQTQRLSIARGLIGWCCAAAMLPGARLACAGQPRRPRKTMQREPMLMPRSCPPPPHCTGRPDILLLDEYSAALDGPTEKKIRDTIESCACAPACAEMSACVVLSAGALGCCWRSLMMTGFDAARTPDPRPPPDVRNSKTPRTALIVAHRMKTIETCRCCLLACSGPTSTALGALQHRPCIPFCTQYLTFGGGSHQGTACTHLTGIDATCGLLLCR